MRGHVEGEISAWPARPPQGLKRHIISAKHFLAIILPPEPQSTIKPIHAFELHNALKRKDFELASVTDFAPRKFGKFLDDFRAKHGIVTLVFRLCTDISTKIDAFRK